MLPDQNGAVFKPYRKKNAPNLPACLKLFLDKRVRYILYYQLEDNFKFEVQDANGTTVAVTEGKPVDIKGFEHYKLAGINYKGDLAGTLTVNVTGALQNGKVLRFKLNGK